MLPGGDGVQILTQPARQTVTLDVLAHRCARSDKSEAVGYLKNS